MPSFNQVFGGNIVYPSDPTYLLLALTANTVLQWPTEQATPGFPVVAAIIEVSTAIAALTVSMPDATQASTGFTTLFNNTGAQSVTIKDSAGGVICVVASGQAWQIYLSDNTTAAGTWRVFQYGAGVSNANAAALAGAGLKAITTTLNSNLLAFGKNANYVIVDGDRATALVWIGGAGSFTFPNPATVANGWYVIVKNLGTGTLTLTPGAGTIDGLTSETLSPQSSAIVISDGANLFTVALGDQTPGNFDYISIDVSGTGNFALAGSNLNRIAYKFTGILTGNRSIIVPNTIQEYWIDNETTGAFTLTVIPTTGLGVAVGQTQKSILYCNGTDVVNAVSAAQLPINLAGADVSGILPNAHLPTNLGGIVQAMRSVNLFLNTVPTADPLMQLQLVANTAYEIEGFLMFTLGPGGTGADGVSISLQYLNTISGLDLILFQGILNNAAITPTGIIAAAVPATFLTAAAVTANARQNCVMFKGQIQTGGGAPGKLILYWGCNTVTGNNTSLVAGSWMKATPTVLV